MYIYLGNLTVEEMEKRCGIEFPLELKHFLQSSHQSNPKKVNDGEWHCFDIPFAIIVGGMETASKIHGYLKPFSSLIKENLQICLSDYKNEPIN